MINQKTEKMSDQEKIVYLINGEAVLLRERLNDGRALICSLYEGCPYDNDYLEDNGQEFEIIEGAERVIDSSKLFNEPPIAAKHEVIKSLDKRIKELEATLKERQEQKREAGREIKQLQARKTDVSKLFFNMEELTTAERLIIISDYQEVEVTERFLRDEIIVQFSLELKKGGVSAKYHKLQMDGGYWDTKSVDPDAGILINPTQGEVDSVIINLVKRDKDQLIDRSYALGNIKDQYLDAELLTEKRRLKKESLNKQLKRVSESLESNKAHVDKLNKELSNLLLSEKEGGQ